MGRRAHGHRFQSGPRQVADQGGILEGQDKGQRPRPKGFSQYARAVVEVSQALGAPLIGDV